jgi:hypothetical protein
MKGIVVEKPEEQHEQPLVPRYPRLDRVQHIWPAAKSSPLPIVGLFGLKKFKRIFHDI